MASRADHIGIERVPQGLVPVVWSQAAPWIAEGLTAARDMNAAGIVGDLASAETSLWLVLDAGQVCGAFLTSIVEMDGEECVFVACLGGDGLHRWARKLADTIIDYCREVYAPKGRFYGRKAYLRLLPDCTVIGSKDEKNFLYERRVS